MSMLENQKIENQNYRNRIIHQLIITMRIP